MSNIYKYFLASARVARLGKSGQIWQPWWQMRPEHSTVKQRPRPAHDETAPPPGETAPPPGPR